MAPSPSRTFSNAFGITLHFRRRRLRRRALTLFCKCKECCSREEKLSSRNADFERRKTPHFVREGFGSASSRDRKGESECAENARQTKTRSNDSFCDQKQTGLALQVQRQRTNRGAANLRNQHRRSRSVAGAPSWRGKWFRSVANGETVRSGKDFAATKSGNCLRSSLASAQS